MYIYIKKCDLDRAQVLYRFSLCIKMHACDVMWCDVMWCDMMWCDMHGICSWIDYDKSWINNDLRITSAFICYYMVSRELSFLNILEFHIQFYAWNISFKPRKWNIHHACILQEMYRTRNAKTRNVHNKRREICRPMRVDNVGMTEIKVF